MKKNLMTQLLLSCKEATMMTAKKEEGKLGLISNMQLSMHLTMCKLCRRFYKASKIIGAESKRIHCNDILPINAKNKIKEMLDDQP